MEIVEAYPFQITRDADVAIQELESDDLLESVEDAIKKRRFSSVVRLQADRDACEGTVEILTTNLPINQQDVYRIRGPIGLAQLMELYSLVLHEREWPGEADTMTSRTL
jgi:polyphosphate kinase